MPAELSVLIVGAVLAGFVQGLSGFAFGMVAMSVWVWAFEPRTAAVLTIFGSLTGQVIAAVSARRAWRWPVLLPFLAGGLLGIPVGGWLLPRIDPTLFKALFGLMLVTWCPLMLFSDRVPRMAHGGRVADGLVGWIGGVMGGLGGFTGVAPTLWCTLRGMDRDLQRSVVQNFNLATLAAMRPHFRDEAKTVAIAKSGREELEENLRRDREALAKDQHDPGHWQ